MTTSTQSTSLHHPVVPRSQWLAARQALLLREKELSRQQDRIAAERRALPWVRVDTPYQFDTTAGPRTLAQLFDGRRQLLVQHFMFGPGWEQGCPSCSYMADHIDGMNVHLANRDITLVVVSRAPLDQIERFRQRMGWRFHWVSSLGSDFNHDYGVSFSTDQVARGEVPYNYTVQRFPAEEAPGISVFYQEPGEGAEVFHTYSTYGRGVEVMMGTYPLVDLTPVGRNEPNPEYTMDWVRHHDRYEGAAPFQPAPSPLAAAASPATTAGGCCHAQA
jgi:predicted dithiol-disulfide oxidoreductase (DUF899 family)